MKINNEKAKKNWERFVAREVKKPRDTGWQDMADIIVLGREKYIQCKAVGILFGLCGLFWIKYLD